MRWRVRQWVSVVSVSMLVSGAVGVLVAFPAGAGLGEVDPNCEVERENGNNVAPLQEPQPELCAELEVSKVVTGQAAPGTTFEVLVDCEAPEEDGIEIRGGFGNRVGTQQNDLPQGNLAPFTETLVFGEDGGAQSIFIGAPGGICTVSEEPPPGCELEGIEPEVTDVDGPEVFPVVVVNSCEVEPVESIEVPAEPLRTAPRFTG